jgi:5-(carboxyamino)imidazole ribonucleotide synthase
LGGCSPSVHVFSPYQDAPAGQVADLETVAPYDDLDAVARFAKQCDVITFEFENIPIATVEAAEQYVPVRPGSAVLEVTQNRLREKRFLLAAGLPVARFRAVRSLSELANAHFLPSVLKTTTATPLAKLPAASRNV